MPTLDVSSRSLGLCGHFAHKAVRFVGAALFHAHGFTLKSNKSDRINHMAKEVCKEHMLKTGKLLLIHVYRAPTFQPDIANRFVCFRLILNDFLISIARATVGK
eukprot:4760433-Amphidinium_carterae.2